MRLQDGPHLCAPAALSNALAALGRDVPPAACAELCGTGVEGTDEDDLVEAVRALGFQPEIVTSWRALQGAVLAGAPVVCAVREDEPYDHWVAAVGVCGDRVLFADPADHAVVRPRDREEWSRWAAGPDGFYGVALES